MVLVHFMQLNLDFTYPLPRCKHDELIVVTLLFSPFRTQRIAQE